MFFPCFRPISLAASFSSSGGPERLKIAAESGLPRGENAVRWTPFSLHHAWILSWRQYGWTSTYAGQGTRRCAHDRMDGTGREG